MFAAPPRLFSYLNEVDNGLDLTTGSSVIGLLSGLTDLFEAQGVSGGDLLLQPAVQALYQLDLQGLFRVRLPP